MAVFRPFRCACGHRPRFNASHCGHCFEATSLPNRAWFWMALALLLVVVIALAG